MSAWRQLALAGLALALAGPAAATSAFDELEQRIVEVAEKVTPSVVHIDAIVRVNDRRKQVSGSGVIASDDGLVLTNEHVVEDAEKVTVSVPGVKKEFLARVVGTDKQTDVAVLRIESGAPLRAARFGSAEDVRVGQWVLAIGNPYGLEGTVSFGIVSAKGRNLELPNTLNDFIQTDAMIDRGSSGGPLVDLEGRVVGINSRGQGRGIGFTIPIDIALEVARELEEGGVERGYLGVTLQPFDRDLAEYFGHPDLTGAVVNSVLDGSPAAKAGVRVGDVILRFGDLAVETEKEEDLGTLQRLVASVPPGEEAEMEILRQGKRRTLSVEIGRQPSVDADEERSELGFHVQEITPSFARDHRLRSRRGAFVVFVARGSPASEAGLYIGDVIERIEDDEVKDLSDFRRAMRGVAGKDRFLVTTQRGNETKYLLMQPELEPAHPPIDPEDPGEAALDE